MTRTLVELYCGSARVDGDLNRLILGFPSNQSITLARLTDRHDHNERSLAAAPGSTLGTEKIGPCFAARQFIKRKCTCVCEMIDLQIINPHMTVFQASSSSLIITNLELPTGCTGLLPTKPPWELGAHTWPPPHRPVFLLRT